MRSVCVVVGLVLAACTGSSVEVGEGPSVRPDRPVVPPGAYDEPKAPEAPEAPQGPTWHADIQPLLSLHCNACHTAGGAGPFAMDTYDQAVAMADAAVASIDAGRMPPWKPDPDCREFQHQRIMPAADKALLKAWIAAGKPKGSPEDAPPQPVAGFLEPTVETTPLEPYEPDPARPDDYRCFPLDVEFEEDTFIYGTEVVPGQREIVHHVLVYRATPDEVEFMERLDAEDPGPGYTCYGGPRLDSVGPLAAWVPGMEPQVFPGDTAFFIQKGSRLVMQLHYNTLAADPAPDLTTLQLLTTTEPRPYVLETRPQADIGLRIPAGEKEHRNVARFVHRGAEPIEVVAMGPHMHVLGTAIKVELERADGQKECLIDIPDWDFNWQQTYRYPIEQSVTVQPGDTFVLTCDYDNSPENQAVVNGERLPPRDVRWGDGTLDEMCLNFIVLRSPFEAQVGRCGNFTGCRAGCEDGDSFGCVAECMSADQSCGSCMLQAIIGDGGCARQGCLGVLSAAQECFFDCYIGGPGLTSCMQETCPENLAAIEGCMGPKIAAGECDGALEACIE